MEQPSQPADFGVKFSSRIEELSTAQDELSHSREFTALPNENQFAIHLILDEIATNVIKYGSPGEPPPIELKFWVTGDHLLVLIEDEGTEFNPLDQPDPNPETRLAELREGGLGIYLIKKTFEELSWSREASRNRLLAAMKISAKN